jgi:hypothetical protein
MTRTELIIQLLKVAIGLAFGAYFVWWSLQVLDRLTPEYDARTAVVARASGIREGLAAGESLDRPAAGSIQNDSGLSQGPATGSVVG